MTAENFCISAWENVGFTGIFKPDFFSPSSTKIDKIIINQNSKHLCIGMILVSA